jgi:hypothetical protein
VPLSHKGKTILAAMKRTYKSAKKAKRVFYASAAAKKITGVHGGKKR